MNDWLPLIRLYSDLFYFSVSACLSTTLKFNKDLLISTARIARIEANLLEIGSKISQSGYVRFMLAMLKIGGTEFAYNRLMMLQKFFEIFESNPQKSIQGWG